MKISLLIFGLFFVLFTFTSRGGYDGYELENFLTARNITLNHSFTLEPGHYGLPGISDTNDGLPHYTRHGIAQPILEVPFFVLGHVLQGKIPSPKVETSISNISSLDAAELISVSLLNIVLSAFIVVLTYLTSLTLFKKRDVSLIAALITGFATIIWPYSAIGLEPLLTVSFLASFYFLLRNKNKSNFLHLLLAGVAIAILINSKNYGFYLSIPLIMYSLAGFKRARLRDWSAFLSIVLAGFFVFIWYNNVRFNNPLGFSPGGFPTAITSIPDSILSFTVSFGKSFFVYSPILILGLFVLKRFFQEHRAEFLVWSATLVLVVGSLFQFWFLPSDEMWGPRYLVLFAPIMAILAAVKFRDLLGTNIGKLISAALLLVSIWVQLIGVSFFGTDPLKAAFQAGAKNMDEVNYVPSFSPVYLGSLMLVSEVSKSFIGMPIIWSKTEQPSWSGSGQSPKAGPQVSLDREGGLVPLVFRFFSKTPALAMSVFLGGITAILIISFWFIRRGKVLIKVSDQVAR